MQSLEYLLDLCRDALERTKQASKSADEASEELTRSRSKLADLEEQVAAVLAEITAVKGKPQSPEKIPALLREPSSTKAPRRGLAADTDDFPIKLASEGPPPSRQTTSTTPPTGKTTPRSKGSSTKGDHKRGGKTKKK